jgi:hypothetical protein
MVTGGVETGARMLRPGTPLFESLGRNWQVLLIASLPGSMLRVWAFLHQDRLAATVDPSALEALGQWSSEHALVTLLMFPLLTIAGSLIYQRYSEPARTNSPVARAGETATAVALPSLDRLSPSARELLCTASFGGALRLERRRTGPAVVVAGTSGRDTDLVCEFHSDSDPTVAQRYRTALTELEHAGLLARGPDGSRPTSIGATAARFLNRQELDRIAARARHLDDAELTLLRIVAECQQRYNAHKVALHRDGTRVCAIFGNGETVVVPGLDPLATTQAEGGEPAEPRTFEQLVQGIPSCYLTPVPGQLPRNPFLVRVTDLGLRYLRHAEVIQRDRTAA